MVNIFLENRRIVQSALISSEFIIPLEEDETSYSFNEEKDSAVLKCVNIENIPTGNNGYPTSWIIDLELQNSIFSSPPSYRMVEKALVFFSFNTLYVILIEIKSSLRVTGESGINEQGLEKKLKNSLTRLSAILPIYAFGENYNDIDKFKLISLIFYNNDNIQQQIETIPNIRNNKLCKVFLNESNHINVRDEFSNVHHIEVKYLQNLSNDLSSMTVDLNEIFADDTEFLNAQYSEYTCPNN